MGWWSQLNAKVIGWRSRSQEKILHKNSQTKATIQWIFIVLGLRLMSLSIAVWGHRSKAKGHRSWKSKIHVDSIRANAIGPMDRLNRWTPTQGERSRSRKVMVGESAERTVAKVFAAICDVLFIFAYSILWHIVFAESSQLSRSEKCLIFINQERFYNYCCLINICLYTVSRWSAFVYLWL